MESLGSYLLTGIVTFTVGVLLMRFQAKSNVVFWSPHSYRWLLGADKNNLELQTDTITIQNIGRAAARNVEIVFGRKPDHFQIQPSVVHQTELLDNGHFAIKIPSLGPKELVTLGIFSYENIPEPQSLRSDDGPAQVVPILLQRAAPKFLIWTLIVLSLIGLGTIAFGLFELGKWALPLLGGLFTGPNPV